MNTEEIKKRIERAEKELAAAKKQLEEANQPFHDYPKSWEELGKVSGEYINAMSSVKTFPLTSTDCDSQNIIPAGLAAPLLELIKLRQCYEAWKKKAGFELDWDGVKTKYIIVFNSRILTVGTSNFYERWLSFYTKEMAEAFLDAYREQIEICRPWL